jgi:hypothetical protein
LSLCVGQSLFRSEVGDVIEDANCHGVLLLLVANFACTRTFLAGLYV